jgi:5S rRNA maturation endonuclease (ribonuclease M5)
MDKIDLNSIIYNEKFAKEELFKVINQEDIYSFYLGEDITTNRRKLFCSPLRQDDVPSFGLYYHRVKTNILMFSDFATKDCGDCIVFVSKLFNLTYKSAILKIAYDFGLANLNITAEKRKKLKNVKKSFSKERIKIGIKRKPWNKNDADYWKQFGIRKKTLIKYNVAPINYVFYNSKAVKLEKLAYSYQEIKDNIISYKIYQPYNKRFKWINNANYTVHQGYRQLPESGNLLIITKSLKDVMSLHDVVNITAIGLQSESVLMKQSVMDEYKQRFKEVICLFDNDKAGKKLSVEFTEKYNIPHFFMPSNYDGVTDFSDLVKVIGIENAKQEFYKCLKRKTNEVTKK